MSSAQAKRRISNGAAFMIAVMVPITIFLIVQLFSDPAVFLTTILKSLAMGSTYAIIALGFVLIFKATEVVNFSQGALAMIGALFISFLVADETIPIIGLCDVGDDDRRAGAVCLTTRCGLLQ